MVDGDHAMSGQTRLWHFITAMLIELEQTEYQFKHQRLTVIPADGETVVLEYPIFTLTATGFVIENWTLEQLSAFFEATEFTEQWYKMPQDKRDQSTIDLENKLAQMEERAISKAPKTVEPKKMAYLPPSLIITLIRSNKPLKPAVWSSLEHYASKGQLTTGLCTALSSVINDDIDGVVPDIVKNAVAAKLQELATLAATPQQRLPARASTARLTGQMSSRRIEEPQFSFDAAMEALDRFAVLTNAELELFEPYRKR